MAEIKQLQMNGVDILPVTHESAVVDNSGTTIANKYQPKTDNSLTTSAKTVTGAINEIKGNLLEVGDQTTTVGSIKVRYVKYNGENFYPMTHTDAVLDSNGAKLSTTLNTLMTSVNTTLPNKLTTIETNVNTLKTSTSNLSTTATTLTNSVGALASLTTSTKTNIVAAINEVFQLGNSARSRLAAALIAKGCQEITASSPLEDILTIIESASVFSTRESWTVEAVSGAQYGFKQVGSGTTWGSSHYWESNNKGVHSSYALCKLVIQNPQGKNVTLHYWNNAESGYDYSCISARNTSLSLSTTIDGKNTFTNTSGYSTYSLGTSKDGWYYIKYRKDGSGNSGNDSLRFYVTIG